MIKTSVNNPPTPGEVFTLPSLTVPDESMSVQQILENFTRGVPIQSMSKVPFYDENFDFDIKSLDLVELDELRQELEQDRLDAVDRLKELDNQRIELQRKQLLAGMNPKGSERSEEPPAKE